MDIRITGFYAGLLALLYLILAARIIRLRWKYRVGIGTGGEDELKVAVRVHGNFIEYVPFILILLGIIEVQGGAAGLVHGIGIATLIARISHVIGLTKTIGPSIFRTIGVLGTFAVLLFSAGICVGQFVGFSLL
ncbi:MAG: MAPEG family protein [Idiomarina sp.]|nr:MAPEG family protein [Idiomarina sp.]